MSEPIDYPSEYDNSARVANSEALIDAFISESQAYREQDNLAVEFDIAYGTEPRNQMDVFWPANESVKDTCPMVMFIHGGYWQRMDRSSFSHLASGLLAHDIAVVMPSYTLCPDIKIDGIINEMRRACLTIFQKYSRKITVVGHSAGGHLAACMLATDWESIHPSLPFDMVSSGMGISGLYDLLPLVQTPVNDAVRMDNDSAQLASPIRWLPEGLLRFDAWVGGEESNEYHRQSREFSEKWSMLGTPTRYIPLPGENHFTIVNGLTDPQSAMVERIVALINQPMLEPDLGEPDDVELAPYVQDFEGLAPTLSSEISNVPEVRADPTEADPGDEGSGPDPEASDVPDDHDGSTGSTATETAVSEPKEAPQRPVIQNRFAGTD